MCACVCVRFPLPLYLWSISYGHVGAFILHLFMLLVVYDSFRLDLMFFFFVGCITGVCKKKLMATGKSDIYTHNTDNFNAINKQVRFYSDKITKTIKYNVQLDSAILRFWTLSIFIRFQFIFSCCFDFFNPNYCVFFVLFCYYRFTCNCTEIM